MILGLALFIPSTIRLNSSQHGMGNRSSLDPPSMAPVRLQVAGGCTIIHREVGMERICFSARVDQDDRSAGLTGPSRCPLKAHRRMQGRR